MNASITRRAFFGRAATGVGTAALASLMGRDLPRGDGRPSRACPTLRRAPSA